MAESGCSQTDSVFMRGSFLPAIRASSSSRASDSALRASVNTCVAGFRLSHAKTPSGFSEKRTRVPPSAGRGFISSVTSAVPAGRPLTRIRNSRGRSASTISEWSSMVSGPTPTLWWNRDPTAGQASSTSRIRLEPTTQ